MAFARPTDFAEEGGASDEGGATVARTGAQIQNSDVIGSPGVADYWLLAAGQHRALPFSTAHIPDDAVFCEQLDPAWREPTVEARACRCSMFSSG